MIRTLDTSPGRLVIEGFRPFPARVLPRLFFASVVVTVSMWAPLVFLMFLADRSDARPLSMWTMLVPAAGLGVLAVGASLVSLLPTQETLSFEGTKATYSRRVLGIRVERGSYDLFLMRGLTLADESDYRRAFVVSGPLMGVWYEGEPVKFGYALEFADLPDVARALLDYDASQRAAVGLDLARGLADTGVWTQSRRLTLAPGWIAPLFQGGRFGRKSDFDR